MFKKLITTLFITTLFVFGSYQVHSATTEYTTLTPSDLNTFNEYRYRITEQFIELRSKFEVDGVIDGVVASRILELAKNGLNYLPDNLINNNYYNSLKSAVERGIKYPENSSQFQSLATAIEDYINKVNIQKVGGNIEAFPSSGNAPLTVSLRGNVVDPSGTKLENYNYTWWVNEGGKRVVLGNRPSINTVFNEEGNYSVFLDVTSNHKNNSGFTDVLPYSGKVNINVNEKIASVILKVNSNTLGNRDELKFTPEEAKYGLLFDATSSTPTSGAKFTRTTWDFGNGVERTYDGPPKVERVVFAREGQFDVKLTLRTNEGKTVTRNFNLIVSNPIATIKASSDEGYLGDTFTFSANPTSRNDYLTYSWRIIDINNDEEILNKSSSTFNYSFREKGIYNVMLYVTEPSGEIDIDTKIIYINSRPPVAEFNHSIKDSHRPNTVFLDGTSSYDPDFSDDGNLEYSWIINGDRVNLTDSNFNGSNGYYTFDSIGEQSVTLEVIDPDGIVNQKNSKVDIKSILSVDFNAFPRVAQRNNSIRFVADSSEARFFEWDFGDGNTEGGSNSTINHTFSKSGVYGVTLTVLDADDNKNSLTRNVYIGDTDSPYAFINIQNPNGNDVSFDPTACSGEGAYVINRNQNFTFSGQESLDVTGKSSGLSYSWRLGKSLYNSQDFQKRFDELGCSELKLVVKSDKNGKEDSETINIEVENIKPTLSGLDVRVKDLNSDPVIVEVSALGAKDEDGVIQSYLWYYYTDVDPEPQDFRSTRTNSTSFVLPKITGNYYFVVVMKDNNEERSISEEVTGSKYFITLTGDNINTPLLDFNVDNSSVGIGDEVTFSANAENILGQNLNNKVKFSWDFDGDGFYDKETDSNVTTHTYSKSGEMRARVKVSNKGFSNTKTLSVNVSNILKPDFEYYSFGNNVVFFDTSLGEASEYEWDLGDGNTSNTQGSFAYEYEDSKNVHLVNLKITEGTKTRDVTKRVVRNVANIIKIRKQDFPVISNKNITEEDKIILEDESEKLYLYFGFDNEKSENFVIDYDTEIDSDLNGGKDDDEDNKNSNSYFSGEPILVELNEFKEQNIRVFTKDSQGKILNSRDFTIVKEYIEEEEIDSSSIIFEGVSDSVKLKLEKIKNLVDSFPKEHKLKGLMYVQRLKEGWNDNREKTNVILEFSSYLDESGVSSAGEIIDILESLLVDGEADRSEKAIALNALKNMLPQNIACIEEEVLEIGGEKVSCYELLVARLEVIGENSNIDENVELGKQILRNVAADTTMSVKQKNDFKAILNTFVYGGVNNIPDEEKEIINENDETINGDSSGIVSVLLSILKVIFYIILLFLFIISGFFIFYKLTNKDKNKSFSDFIVEKTSGTKSNKSNKNNDVDDVKDILGDDMLSKKSDTKDAKGDEEFVDPFAYDEPTKFENIEKENSEPSTQKYPEKNKTEPKKELEGKQKIAQNNNSGQGVGDGGVPDWLKGSFEGEFSNDENKQKESETKVFEPNFGEEKNQEAKLPDNKISHNKPLESKTTEKKSFETQAQKPKENQKTTQQEPKKDTKSSSGEAKTDSQIPDWLKGSFDEDIKSQDNMEENSNIPKENLAKDTKKEELNNIGEKNPKTDKSQTLKNNTSTKEKYVKPEKNTLDKTTEKVEEKPKKSEIPKEKEANSDSFDKNKTEEKNIPQPKKVDSEEKKSDLELNSKEELDNLTKIEDEKSVTNNKTESSIPDWLKGSFDDEKKSEEKKQELVPEKKSEDKILDKKTNDESIKNSDSTLKKTEERTIKPTTIKKAPLKKEAKVEDNKVEKNDLTPDSFDESDTKESPKKSSQQKTTKTTKKINNEKVLEEKPKSTEKDKAEVKQKEAKKTSTQKGEKEPDKKQDSNELWDDGMKIPDWLKTDEDDKK